MSLEVNFHPHFRTLRIRYLLVYILLVVMILSGFGFLSYNLLYFYLEKTMAHHLRASHFAIESLLREEQAVEPNLGRVLKPLTAPLQLIRITVFSWEFLHEEFSTDGSPPEDRDYLLVLDREEIYRAKRGGDGIGIGYLDSDGLFNKRGYFPLTVGANRYVLSLTVDSQFFLNLHEFDRTFKQVVAMAVVLAVLLGVVAVYWLLSPLQRLLERMASFRAGEPWGAATHYPNDTFGLMQRIFDGAALSAGGSISALKLERNRHQELRESRERELGLLFSMTQLLEIRRRRNFHRRWMELLFDCFEMDSFFLVRLRRSQPEKVWGRGEWRRELIAEAVRKLPSDSPAEARLMSLGGMFLFRSPLLPGHLLAFQTRREEEGGTTPFFYVYCSLFAAGIALGENLKKIFQLKNRMKNLLKSIGVSIFTLDARKRVTFINSEGRANLRIATGFADWASRFPTLGSLLDRPALENHRVTGDPAIPFPYQVNIDPLVGPDGVILGKVVIVQDIASRMALENQLRQAETMASLGQMAASVAHEIRNPLAAMQGYVELLGRQNNPPLDGRGKKYVELLLGEIGDLSALTRNFLKFAKPPTYSPERVNLSRLVEEAVAFAGVSDRGFVVHQEVPSDLTIEGDFGMLKSVCINLTQNAFQATEAVEGGGNLHIQSITEPGGGVQLHFTDNGPGIKIPPEKLFQPFFSTKAKGSGLGLAFCKKIMELHGGSIQFIEMAGGAHFVLAFGGEKRESEPSTDRRG